MLKGFPCKIIDFAGSKPGKVGIPKAHMIGIDILTGKKYEDIMPKATHVEMVSPNYQELEVADIANDDFVSLVQ